MRASELTEMFRKIAFPKTGFRPEPIELPVLLNPLRAEIAGFMRRYARGDLLRGCYWASDGLMVIWPAWDAQHADIEKYYDREQEAHDTGQTPYVGRFYVAAEADKLIFIGVPDYVAHMPRFATTFDAIDLDTGDDTPYEDSPYGLPMREHNWNLG